MEQDTFGKRLRELRKEAGMSQDKLAEILGVSFMTVRRWEAKKREPRLEEIKRISAALGVSEAELLNGPEKETVRLEIIFGKMDDDEKEVIDMSKKSVFNVFLGADGTIGLRGGGKFTSLKDIEEFWARGTEQLKAAFQWQTERGALAGA